VLVDEERLELVEHRRVGHVVVAAIDRARPDGVQNIVLSSGYGREFGTVYGGDGDIRSAAKLLEFLNHRLPEEKDGKLDNSARNECTALP